MTDRELLELAAKAAGIHIHHWFDQHEVFMCSSVDGGDPDYGWNPLTNDGDALRLAVKLRFHISIFSATDGEEKQFPATVEVQQELDTDPLHVEYVEGAEYGSATRRAIVRAATEIGKNMP